MSGFTHLDDSGAARMVDVGAKEVTARTATATGRVDLSAECVALLRGFEAGTGGVPKGDALGVARVAGILGAKRTPDLVPLCHPLPLSGVTVDLVVDDAGVAVTATASGRVDLSAECVALLRAFDAGTGGVPKGDALGVARVAGIMGAKRTPDLVPLCHPLPLSGVTVDLVVDDAGVAVTATARTSGRTGVEMEALTAVAVACLTVVDMTKAVDPRSVIREVRVETKTGGKTGEWSR